MSSWPITHAPGTCGGCKHFKRFNDRNGRPAASGKCAEKPNTRWIVFQSSPACKKDYEPKEETP